MLAVCSRQVMAAVRDAVTVVARGCGRLAADEPGDVAFSSARRRPV